MKILSPKKNTQIYSAAHPQTIGAETKWLKQSLAGLTLLSTIFTFTRREEITPPGLPAARQTRQEINDRSRTRFVVYSTAQITLLRNSARPGSPPGSFSNVFVRCAGTTLILLNVFSP